MFKSQSRRKGAVQKANRQELMRGLEDEWKDLCDAEGLDVVVGVMGRFEDDAEVQERCFCAMSSIMKAKESVYLTHERDLRRTAEVFARYAGQSEGILKHGLLVLVLELLRTGGRTKGIIFECLGGLPLIVTALSLRGDAEVVSRCCFIIGLFCDDDGPAGSACREELGRTDAVRHIVEQLGAHQDSQVVARFGAFALGHVSLNSAENVARIVSAGGVEALVRAMKQFRGSADLQEFCCYALGNIGYNNVRNQERIAMADGIDAIVAANTRFIAQPKIALNSCIALANLAFIEGNGCSGSGRSNAPTSEGDSSADERSLAAAIQEMLRKKEAIAAVVSTMRVYRTNRTIQRACCCALANIARGCPANQAAVGEAAGVEVLLGVLTRINDSAPVQRWGLLALGTIVEGNAALAARAGEHGGIAVAMRGAVAASTPGSALYKSTRTGDSGGDVDHALLQKVCAAGLYALACMVGSEEARVREARGLCPENVVRAADAKCVETAVLACMSAYPKSADVLRHSLGIVAHVLGTAGRPGVEALRGVVESGAAVTHVVGAIRCFMESDAEVVSLACLVLGRLAHMGKEPCELVAKCCGPTAIAAALERHDGDPWVQRRGLFALGVLCAQVSLAGSAAAEKELRAEKGVREGAPLSEAWLMDQTRVGSRGGNRSYTPECIFARSAHGQLTVLVAGGIDLAVQALRGFPDDAAVLGAAMYALARAAEGNAEAKRQATSLGAIELAVAAMSHFPTDAVLLFGGCVFLAVMALNGRAQRRAAACGGIAVIIATLLTHMDEARIAVVALLALGLMAANNAENQAMIRTAGGIENVVAALTRYSGNEKAAENACFALALITLESPECAAEASARGGVPAVMAALREHSGANLYALKWGLTALANMSAVNNINNNNNDNNNNNNDNGTSPLMFALVKLEENIPESEELTLCALRVVAAVASCGSAAGALDILCNKEKVGLVLDAVSKYPDSPKIVENGFRALGGLCSREVRAQDLVRDAGGIDFAVATLRSAGTDEGRGSSSSSSAAAAMAEGVLYAVAGAVRANSESQRRFLAAGGIEAVGEALERHGGRAAGVAEWACRAFESAVRGSAEATARFADKGCVQLVVTHALARSSEGGDAAPPAVQRAAYGVLMAVAADAGCKSILGRFDGVARIARALTAVAGDEAALGEGLAVLAAVAARSPVNQKALGACVEAVVAALARARGAQALEAGLLALAQALHSGSTSECRIRAYRCGAVAALFRAMKGLSSSSAGYRAGAKALVRLTTVRAAHTEVLHPEERPALIVKRLEMTCGGADPEEQDALLGVLANLACTMRPLPTLPAGPAVEALLSSLTVVKKGSTVQRCLTALGGLVVADPACARSFRANAGVEILSKVLAKSQEGDSAKVLESAAFVLAVALDGVAAEEVPAGVVELVSSLAEVSYALLKPCAAAISRRGAANTGHGHGHGHGRRGCPLDGTPCVKSDCPFAGKPQRYCGACCTARWVYYCETCNRAPDSGSGGAVILCESCWKRHDQKHSFRKMFIPWKCTM